MAQLVISAASPSQFPESSQQEIVFVGKSNVGKSTLINGLNNRKNLAYVGKTPGKTRLVNFYEIDENLMMVDVPGYGYARRSVKEQENYARLMEHYFSHRENLKGMILIIDSRRGMSEDDWMMVELAREKKLAMAIALSKSNKLSFSKLKQVQMKTQSQSKLPVFTFDTDTYENFETINNQIQKDRKSVV